MHTDHQSSVRALTDETGAIVNEYAYTAYGDGEAAVEGVEQAFRYTGRRFEPETGLYHYRARDYDPATARFLQEDPIHFAAGDMNIYRYVWNNPLNWTDPSGLAAATEYGVIARKVSGPLALGARALAAALRSAHGTAAYLARGGGNVLSRIGARVNCNMFTVASAIAAGTEYGGVAVEAASVMLSRCRVNPSKKTRWQLCKVCPCKRGGNSFGAGTLVQTRNGMVAIEDIKIGDEVAAIDELTGKQVWRKVVETYSRTADHVFELKVKNADGEIETFHITGEHPVHVEDWAPSSVEELLSSLQREGLVLSDAQTSSLPAGLEAYDYFPSEETTKFGDWVKAGALKAGDQLSIRDGFPSVAGQEFGTNSPARERAQAGGAAKTNQTLTVVSNTRDNTPTRVYNLEIESRPGEITHNYFVGSDGVLVHNGTGAYILWCADGGKYVGKGDQHRMNRNFRRKCNNQGYKRHFKSRCDHSSERLEDRLMRHLGWKGKGTPGFKNINNSPGRNRKPGCCK